MEIAVGLQKISDVMNVPIAVEGSWASGHNLLSISAEFGAVDLYIDVIRARSTETSSWALFQVGGKDSYLYLLSGYFAKTGSQSVYIIDMERAAIGGVYMALKDAAELRDAVVTLRRTIVASFFIREEGDWQPLELPI